MYIYLKSLVCFIAVFLCGLLNAMSGEFSGEVVFGKRAREEERSFQASKSPRLVLALPPLARRVPDTPSTTYSYLRARELGQRAPAASMHRNIVARIQSNALTLSFSQINESTLASLAETRQLFTIGELNIQPSRNRSGIVPVALSVQHIRLISRYFPALTSITTDINVFMSRGAFEELAKSALAPMLVKLKINFTEDNRSLDGSLLIKIFSSFKSLRELSVSCREDENLKALWLRALAESGIERTLRVLEIGEESIEAKDFNAKLLDRFESLEALHLWGNQVGDAGFSALAQSSIAGNLIALDMAHSKVTQEGFRLKFLNNFKRLRNLNAWANEIGNEGFEALALSEIARTIYKLNIGNNDIAGSRLSSRQFDRFNQLRVLNISHNLCYNILKELAESKLAKYLQVVDVSRNFITGGHIDPEYLNKLVSLRELDLSFNIIRDEGFLLFLQSEVVNRLYALNLSGTYLTDAVFIPQYLNMFTKLKKLYVASNCLTDTTLKRLAQSKLALNLELLDVRFNAISTLTLNQFRNTFPQAKVL